MKRSLRSHPVCVGASALVAAALGVACSALLGVNDLPPRSATDGGDDARTVNLRDATIWPGSLDPTFGDRGIVVVKASSPLPPSVVADGLDTVVVVPSGADKVEVMRYSDEGTLAQYHPVEIRWGPAEITQAVPAIPADRNGVLVFAIGTDGNQWSYTSLTRVTIAGGLEPLLTSFVGLPGTGTIELAVRPTGSISIDTLDSPGDAGRLNLSSLLNDGGQDGPFGTDGLERFNTPFEKVLPRGSAGLNDGRIIVVGDGYIGDTRWAFWMRFAPDGGVDRAFGPDGGLGLDTRAQTASAILADDAGYFVSGATPSLDGQGERGLLYRLGADGRRDPSYWDAGAYEFMPQSYSAASVEAVVALASPSDDVLLALGIARPTNGVPTIALLRVDRNGPDPTFGDGGSTLIDRGSLSGPHGMALRSDGKLLVSWLDPAGVVKVARYVVR